MKNQTMNEIRKAIEDGIKTWEKAFEDNNAAAMNAAEIDLKANEKAWNDISMKSVLDECKHSDEDPVVAAIRKFTYPAIDHKIEKKDGKITGIKLVDDKQKKLDLKKVFIYFYNKTSYIWEYKVERAGCLLTMRAAYDLGWDNKAVKAIDGLYYLSEFARKEEMGVVPTSNTQVCKLLQKCIDAIIFEDNGNGANKYKCVNADVTWLLIGFTKHGKDGKTVEVCKPRQLNTIIFDVLHRIVTGGKWDLKFKQNDTAKATDVEQKADEEKPAKASPKKASKAKKTDVVKK